MSKKITKMTPRQELRLAEVYEEWLGIGRSTQPIDKSAAEKIIGEFYGRIGKPKPTIFYFSSPMICVLAWGALKCLAKDSQLYSQLRSQLDSQLGNRFAGAHWCCWEVFYKFASEIGVEYSPEDEKLLDLWLEQSRNLHWWFPYDGIVFVSDRHTIVEVDAQGRLHSDKGQACGYSDKWGIWAWHGVIVPQRIIEQPETITAKEILAEENAEIRRVMIERVGMDRFIADAKAKEIHKHDRGILFSVDLPGDPERVLRAVRVTDPSTGRMYFLRIPPQINNVQEAISWTFNMKPNEYNPIAET